MTVRRSSITQTTLEASWIGCGIHRFCALKGCFEISDYSSFISRVISKRLTSKKLMQIKKVLGLAVLVAAFAFVGASSAHAATAQELQDQINALLAQISSLQGGSSSTSCYSFTRDLTVGSQGADVTALQNYLAAGGYFKVAATGYFGSVTAQAVSAWQSAAGVSPAAGYFGAISRAKYNSTCSSTSGDDDDNSGNGGFNTGNGEEASLTDYDTKDGSDTSLEEGQTDAEVLDFEFDVDDSDVEVQRVQVNFEFTGTATGEDKPWKVFKGAHLLMDGDEVASIDNVDEEDTWSDEGTDEWSLRFNNVGEVVKDGDTGQFTVALDVEDSVDGSGTAGANEWTVSIDNDSVRALDEAGIDQYAGDSSDTVTGVTIDEAGQNDELNVTESDNDVDSTVFDVETTETSDWMTIGTMQLSADGDLQLNDVRFDIAAANGSDTYDGLVNDVQILIDGQKYNDFTVNNPTTATGTLIFDLSDDDVMINDGDEVDVEVQVEFKALTGNFDEGDNIVLNASSTGVDSWDVEGAESGEGLDSTQLKGSYEGEVHSVRSSGVSVTLGDVSGTEASPVGGDEAQADFWIEFTVHAFGENFWVAKGAAVDTTPDGTGGVEYAIQTDADVASTTASVSDALTPIGSSSTGDSSYGYKVSEGTSRTFKLQVSFDATGTGTAGYYHAQIYGIDYDDDSAGGSPSYISTGLEDFQTEDDYVSNADTAN